MTENERNSQTMNQAESYRENVHSLDPGLQIEMSASVAGVVPDGKK